MTKKLVPGNDAVTVEDDGQTTFGERIKFTARNLLPTVVAGVMEYYNNALWFTNLAVRRTVVQGQSVRTTDITVSNTTTKTIIFTQAHGANYPVVGKCEEIIMQGIVNTLSGASDTGTVRLEYGGNLLGSFIIPKSVGGKNFDLHCLLTFRAIGNGTTSIQVHANFDIEGLASDPVYNGLTTGLNSTTAQATDISIQWTTADAGDNMTVYQAYALSIDNNA